MPRGEAPKKNKKGKSQSINWEDWEDPNCVAEHGWENEPKKTWTASTCKKYVQMTHISKVWPRERAEQQVRRWEGQTSTCLSRHFVHRYEEVTRNAGVRDSKPNVMNYTNMAMVWAEIVLHKDVDWRTIYGKDVAAMNRTEAVIYTSWTQASDCMPEWSNRGQFGFPANVMPDVEDPVTDDDDDEDVVAPATFGERHERRESREDIDYEQQMREATRRSLQDRGPQDGYDGYYGRERSTYAPSGGRSSSEYGNAPPTSYQSMGGSHGTGQYAPSSQGGSQYYSGSSGGASYGDYGHRGGSYQGGSNEQGSYHGSSVPPPTFGGPYYGNYGQGGAASGGGDVYGGGPYLGVYGGGSTGPSRRDDTDSDSE